MITERLTPEKLLDALKPTAQGIVMSGDQHMPLIFFMRGTPERGYQVHQTGVLELPDDGAQRLDVMQQVQAMLKDQGYDAYIYINEVWMYVTKDPNIANWVRAVHHPDREEFLVMQFVSKEGVNIWRQYPIIRPKVGNPRLGPVEPDRGEIVGQMSNFFTLPSLVQRMGN
jgi:hypothetical protein